MAPAAFLSVIAQLNQYWRDESTDEPAACRQLSRKVLEAIPAVLRDEVKSAPDSHIDCLLQILEVLEAEDLIARHLIDVLSTPKSSISIKNPRKHLIEIRVLNTKDDYYIYLSTEDESRTLKTELNSRLLEIVQKSDSIDLTRERKLEELQGLGQAIFQFLIPTELRPQWYRKFNLPQDDCQTYIKLHFNDAPGLEHIPWELMYDDDFNAFVVLQPGIVLARSISNKRYKAKPLSPLRLLVLASNPSGLDGLDTTKEVEAIKAALVNNRQIEYKVIKGTLEGMRRELSSFRPHALHFIGHGGFDQHAGGYLCFEEDNGEVRYTSSETLVSLLRPYPLDFVFLNSCQGSTGMLTSIAAAIARADIPAVLAMQYPLSDMDAIRFSEAFYYWLATEGSSVADALLEARLHLVGQDGLNVPSWMIPTLFLSGDGILV